MMVIARAGLSCCMTSVMMDVSGRPPPPAPPPPSGRGEQSIVAPPRLLAGEGVGNEGRTLRQMEDGEDHVNRLDADERHDDPADAVDQQVALQQLGSRD